MDGEQIAGSRTALSPHMRSVPSSLFPVGRIRRRGELGDRERDGKGGAGKGVAAVLDPHFADENSYALPPIGLLMPCSEGKSDCSMTGVLKVTDQLEAAMPRMLAEHKEIVAALDKLATAANSENNAEGVKFAQALMPHAQIEERC